MKKITNKKIGVWGFGIVGKAAVTFFKKQGYYVSVMDKRTLHEDEQNYLSLNDINFYGEENKNYFFYINDFLFSSPGINIDFDYPTHKDKWIHELDIFYENFKKPIIAITGSIGKTSITYIFSHIMQKHGFSVCVGGNIGTPTFELIEKQHSVDFALIEVSSFQLHRCKKFAPYVAVWTNFYPNHLDHHKTQENYFSAKANIIMHQTKNQFSLLPLSLKKELSSMPTQSKQFYFSPAAPTVDQKKDFSTHETVYYITDNTVVKNNKENILLSLSDIPFFTFQTNILIFAALCDMLNIDPNIIKHVGKNIALPAHRLEKVTTINMIDFYNDSKATTIESTMTAIDQFKTYRVHLFLGGLSKGVDKQPLITYLKNKVTHIYSFGAEAEKIHSFCLQENISSSFFSTLDDAFNYCKHNIQSGDIVLLSPSGSSYDLYNNYQERGEHFKKLINEFKKSLAPALF